MVRRLDAACDSADRRRRRLPQVAIGRHVQLSALRSRRAIRRLTWPPRSSRPRRREADLAASRRRLVRLVPPARQLTCIAHPAVAQALGENFILMKVNSGDENQNQRVLVAVSRNPRLSALVRARRRRQAAALARDRGAGSGADTIASRRF